MNYPHVSNIEKKISAVIFCAAFTCSTPLIAGVRLHGPVGDRLNAMIERHVAAVDVDAITETFAVKSERQLRWQTEFWGKWMHSAVPLADYSGSTKIKNSIKRSVERILSTQEPSGYIGNYPNDMRCNNGWDVWGIKYTMMGLMHYHDAEKAAGNPDAAKRAIDACARLCDYLISEIGPNGRSGREPWQTGCWSGYASSSVLEPVVWLYNRTGEKRYFEFAEHIVWGMATPESGPRLVDLALKGISVADRNGYGKEKELEGYVMLRSRRKAYEMMSCYQGLLEYAAAAKSSGFKTRISSDVAFKAAAMTAEDIAKEEVDVAGGCSSAEIWYHGAKNQHLSYRHLHETCVTITWMRLCEKMLDMTGNPKWADELERTFYNAYLGALRLDGSEFASYTPLNGCKWHGMDHCNMHTDCCQANGPRGFLCFLDKMFVTKGNTATINFYASSSISGELSGGRVIAFDVYTRYPRTDKISITGKTSGDASLKLRIPCWSQRTSVSVNGNEMKEVKPGEYFTIQRKWEPGDTVEIVFDMTAVAHVQSGHVAFTRGPVLLARDSRFDDGDTAEPVQPIIKNAERIESFVPVQVPSDDFWMTFAANLPLGWHHSNIEGRLPVAVMFCDYASAGGMWNRKNHYRTWFPFEIKPPH